MEKKQVRVRFAPAPTGFMHLGNVRTALMNYVFAQQEKGSFIVRIEDTDAERNIDPGALHILKDLAWLGLHYDEGPVTGGSYAPYFQSERAKIYQNHLGLLFDKGFIYRCFCSQEELEKKRHRQITLKQPPRYDRTCLKNTEAQTQEMLDNQIPFIWRFKLPDESIEIQDLARGTIHFELKNFSDPALSRQDGSATFLLANCIDDIAMNITHVFRGEDHLSNTALQAIFYKAFNAPLPVYWHMPIICNSEGKKLSKRDFGFSLNDLRATGFLPSAINNYLALLGASAEEEIMGLQDLVGKLNFKQAASAGQIKYDIEKLRWLNHKWIQKITINDLTALCMPYLKSEFPLADNLTKPELERLLTIIKPNIIILSDCVNLLEFYFKRPIIDEKVFKAFEPKALNLVSTALKVLKQFSAEEFVNQLRTKAKAEKIPLHDVFGIVRYCLTGLPEGLGVKEILAILPTEETIARLSQTTS